MTLFNRGVLRDFVLFFLFQFFCLSSCWLAENRYMVAWNVAGSSVIGWRKSCGTSAPLSGGPASNWARGKVTNMITCPLLKAGRTSRCSIPDCPALLDWNVPCGWTVDNVLANDAQVSVSNDYWYDSIESVSGYLRDPQSSIPKQATATENLLSRGRKLEQGQTHLLMGWRRSGANNSELKRSSTAQLQ